MFIVRINPTGVEEVLLASESEATEDISLAAWPIVRKHLGKLHKDLGKTARKTIETLNGWESR